VLEDTDESPASTVAGEDAATRSLCTANPRQGQRKIARGTEKCHLDRSSRLDNSPALRVFRRRRLTGAPAPRMPRAVPDGGA
jgi:hypothetical protein